MLVSEIHHITSTLQIHAPRHSACAVLILFVRRDFSHAADRPMAIATTVATAPRRCRQLDQPGHAFISRLWASVVTACMLASRAQSLFAHGGELRGIATLCGVERLNEAMRLEPGQSRRTAIRARNGD